MSLKDKASKVNFSALPMVGPGHDGEGVSRPKTAPGAMMAFANDQRSDLLRQNDVLQEQAARAGDLQTKLDESLADLKQWEGAKATRQIDPTDIRPSRFANRHVSSFATAEFETLKAELKEAGGNVQPVKVRQVSGEGTGREVRAGLRSSALGSLPAARATGPRSDRQHRRPGAVRRNGPREPVSQGSLAMGAGRHVSPRARRGAVFIESQAVRSVGRGSHSGWKGARFG